MSLMAMAESRLRCLRTMRVLQSYLDGEVGEPAGQEVAEHLEQCRRCGLEAATYRAIKASLRHRGRPVDPAALARLQRFAEALAAGPAGEGA